LDGGKRELRNAMSNFIREVHRPVAKHFPIVDWDQDFNAFFKRMRIPKTLEQLKERAIGNFNRAQGNYLITFPCPLWLSCFCVSSVTTEETQSFRLAPLGAILLAFGCTAYLWKTQPLEKLISVFFGILVICSILLGNFPSLLLTLCCAILMIFLHAALQAQPKDIAEELARK